MLICEDEVSHVHSQPSIVLISYFADQFFTMLREFSGICHVKKISYQYPCITTNRHTRVSTLQSTMHFGMKRLHSGEKISLEWESTYMAVNCHTRIRNDEKCRARTEKPAAILTVSDCQSDTDCLRSPYDI